MINNHNSGLQGANKFIIAVLFLLLLPSVRISFSSTNNLMLAEKEKLFKPVIEKLLIAGSDSNFVYNLIADKNTEFNERFVKINVTGYLKKPDYSHHFNDYSVKKVSKFFNENSELLSKASKKFDVPAEVIASVMWIETKFGGYLGKSHVPSVYLSTALASEKEYIDMNVSVLKNSFKGNDEELDGMIQKIEARANKKSNWAINELLALEKIQKDEVIDIYQLKGSWAGAFGLSQFLPSSYVKWAYDGNNNGRTDLFELEDATYSIANYLKSNGWGKTKEEQRDAVWHYNNSTAYVDAVLKLSEKIGFKQDTLPPLSRMLQNN